MHPLLGFQFHFGLIKSISLFTAVEKQSYFNSTLV